MTEKEHLEEIILSMDLKKEIQQKVVDNYQKMHKAGFEERAALFLAAAYFTGEPDETVEPLLRRLKRIMESRTDIISGAMLAASYYGMEELSMRLPILEEGVKNISANKEWAEALTGIIMIADGGPAEVAKAIQWYMFLMKKQIDMKFDMKFDMKSCRMARVIGILAVLSSPNILGEKMFNKITKKLETEIKKENVLDIEALFFDEICKFIKQLQRQEEEHIRKLQRTSYTILTGEKNVTASDFDYNKEDGPEEELSLNGSNLFTGMKQEVDIILTAIHLI